MVFRRLKHALAGLALLTGGVALAEPVDPRARVERLLSHHHQTRDMGKPGFQAL